MRAAICATDGYSEHNPESTRGVKRYMLPEQHRLQMFDCTWPARVGAMGQATKHNLSQGRLRDGFAVQMEK
jgi:hypothetical protein